MNDDHSMCGGIFSSTCWWKWSEDDGHHQKMILCAGIFSATCSSFCLRASCCQAHTLCPPFTPSGLSRKIWGHNWLPSHLKSTMDVGIPKLRTLMYDAPWVPWTTGMTLQCSNSTRKSMTYQSMTRHNNTNNAKTLRSSNSTRKCKTFQNITNQI